MKIRRMIRFFGILTFLFCMHLQAQNPDTTAAPKKNRHSIFLIKPSDKDVILLITSIEWGIPDRWSFTSRYIHMFYNTSERITWHHNFSVTMCPGVSGGRLGAGYLCIYSPKSMRDAAVFGEARAVLLRTWGNPLVAAAGRTFAGAEVRVGFAAIINMGAGYYRQISGDEPRRDAFWGYHIGVGI